MRQEIENKMTLRKRIYKRRIIKSLIYTFLSILVSIWGVFALFSKIFNDQSAESQHTYLIMGFLIFTIFIALFCTFTILDKLGNRINNDIL